MWKYEWIVERLSIVGTNFGCMIGKGWSMNTLPETMAPTREPSQKETSLPTHNFQVLRFWGGNSIWNSTKTTTFHFSWVVFSSLGVLCTTFVQVYRILHLMGGPNHVGSRSHVHFPYHSHHTSRKFWTGRFIGWLGLPRGPWNFLASGMTTMFSTRLPHIGKLIRRHLRAYAGVVEKVLTCEKPWVLLTQRSCVR